MPIFGARLLLLLASTLVLVSAPALARAQSPGAEESVSPEPNDLRAQALYVEGQRAFEIGQYSLAAEKFEAAYELSPRSPLLFNLGATHGHLQHNERALAYYEQYLQELPQASNRPAVEARIAALQTAIARDAQLAQGTTAEEPAQAGVPLEVLERNEREREVNNTAPIILITVGGVFLATSLVFGLIAEAQYSSLENTCGGFVCTAGDGEGDDAIQDESDLNQRRSNGDTFALFSTAMLALGAVVLGAGLIWLILVDDDDDGSLSIGPGFVRGTF